LKIDVADYFPILLTGTEPPDRSASHDGCPFRSQLFSPPVAQCSPQPRTLCLVYPLYQPPPPPLSPPLPSLPPRPPHPLSPVSPYPVSPPPHREIFFFFCGPCLPFAFVVIPLWHNNTSAQCFCSSLFFPRRPTVTWLALGPQWTRFVNLLFFIGF